MKYIINTSPDLSGMAPKDHAWIAFFGDYDEGVSCGHGATEEAAIADLVTNHDLVAA